MKSYNARVVGPTGTAIKECVSIGTVMTSSKITYTTLGSDLILEAAMFTHAKDIGIVFEK